MSKYIAEKFKHNGYTVKLIADQDATAPDKFDEDDLFIVTTKNRYFQKLHNGNDARATFEDEEFKAKYHVFVLNSYIHSGVALSLSNGYPFNDQWDGGQIGFVFAEKESWATEDEARKAAETYVETWNQYLSGDVWGFVIEDADGNDVDSCWGLYGLKYARTEAISNVPDEPCPVNGSGEDVAAEESLP